MAFRTPMFIDEQHRGTRSKYGSSNPAKALKCLSFGTAQRITNRVIVDSVTSACGLKTCPVPGDSNCRF